ncbi:MAG: hypothetical protein A2087_14140 [Spirochaetes bacterium GWD1_61_31]|nr:MAG: hypothetical protein A2Y37_02090 [Spirochaetes bacterium GWB1_60_80]OHD33119.1 MAG: hypothetical protein A2004_12375 [Spirochaetes bacterium GWC1_61_12]OHD39585.1 MAG: hypothetical protein A2087_14140 [Spirochaetes bacterium GWD1_61_31]OHD43839.1 MAG: hypothetical protein A2Y35_00320 [Spirochaetes bacterium GWE1_60_18]OHD61173.1 MAG: hypothetical protein A2Y32_03650 [Spirochaetes bacterium GWF1_60_12]HAP44270.1 hypothetical protein [Spirochaetaceae bacterium]
MSQLERVAFIHQAIREDGGVTSARVRDHFEVDDRTVKRDLEFMKDRLGAPVVWNRDSASYRYKGDYDELDFLNERNLLFSVVIRGLCGNPSYVPFVTGELAKAVEASIPRDYLKIAASIIFETEECEPPPMEKLKDIFRSLIDRMRLALTYTDPSGKTTVREIEPLKIVNYSGRWYVVALDSISGELRNFLVGRMRKTILTHSPFTGDFAQEKVDRYMEGSFGIYKGAPTEQARLAFTGKAARIVRDQVWHPSQTLNEEMLSDGQVRLVIALPIAHYPEILGKALRWGASCEILAPEGLRKAWMEEIETMRERFCSREKCL